MFPKMFLIHFFIACVWGRNSLPDRSTDDFHNQCLQLHNNYRVLHNTDPLQMDQRIVSYAKSRCNYISQFESLSAGHSGLELGTYGENLYWSGSTDGGSVGASNAIKSWYDEIQSYNYKNPTFSSGTGHFTQLIWKSTTRVGCAMCGGQGGQWYETYVVCNYQPAGNVMGRFAQNALPLNGLNPKPSPPIPSEPNEWPTDIIPTDGKQQYTICKCSKSDGVSGQQYQYIFWS